MLSYSFWIRTASSDYLLNLRTYLAGSFKLEQQMSTSRRQRLMGG